MLVTEEEAKTRWCPFALTRVWEVAINRARPDDAKFVEPHCKCLASGCMAWRWAEEKNAEAEAAFEAACPTGASLGCDVVGPSPVGYCGKVGNPS